MFIRSFQKALESGAAVFLVTLCLNLRGQTIQHQGGPSVGRETPLDFDAVSVKQNKTTIAHPGSMIAGDGFYAENQPLSLLLSWAFGFAHDPKESNFSGLPNWVDSDRFDIIAKVAPADIPVWKGLSGPDRQSMIRRILMDRFKLKVHQETRRIPIYALTVADGGPKLTKVEARLRADGHSDGNVTQSRIGLSIDAVGAHATMKTLASYLSKQQDVGREVQDETGLIDHYDFDLKFTISSSEDTQSTADTPEISSSPFIITALKEQLGLRLVPKEGIIETTVIDHIERPSLN